MKNSPFKYNGFQLFRQVFVAIRHSPDEAVTRCGIEPEYKHVVGVLPPIGGSFGEYAVAVASHVPGPFRWDNSGNKRIIITITIISLLLSPLLGHSLLYG
jgi:hypothetical protein